MQLPDQMFHYKLITLVVICVK